MFELLNLYFVPRTYIVFLDILPLVHCTSFRRLLGSGCHGGLYFLPTIERSIDTVSSDMPKGAIKPPVKFLNPFTYLCRPILCTFLD
jgi:hypothetical protein